MAAASIDSPEFLTSDQVVKRLLSNATLRRQASTCVLPAVRVGEEWLFRSRDLESWIVDKLAASMRARRDA